MQSIKVLCLSKEHVKFLYSFPEAKGVRYVRNEEDHDKWFDRGLNHIYFNSKVVNIAFCTDAHEAKTVTTDEWIKFWQSYEPIHKIQLTDNYTAVINKQDKTITVGCQTIPFSKVEELYKAIKS